MLKTLETDQKKNYRTEDPIKKCCDAGTQTEEQYLNPKIQLMEITIKNLCDRIKSLEAQLKTPLDPSIYEASFETSERDLDFSCESNDQDPDFEMVCLY